MTIDGWCDHLSPVFPHFPNQWTNDYAKQHNTEELNFKTNQRRRISHTFFLDIFTLNTFIADLCVAEHHLTPLSFTTISSIIYFHFILRHSAVNAIYCSLRGAVHSLKWFVFSAGKYLKKKLRVHFENNFSFVFLINGQLRRRFCRVTVLASTQLNYDQGQIAKKKNDQPLSPSYFTKIERCTLQQTLLSASLFLDNGIAWRIYDAFSFQAAATLIIATMKHFGVKNLLKRWRGDKKALEKVRTIIQSRCEKCASIMRQFFNPCIITWSEFFSLCVNLIFVTQKCSADK